MERIKLWAIGGQDVQQPSEVEAAVELTNTEAEGLLEDLLVASPSLLMPGLALVGRQLPTAGGPLDLLGVDQDGRLVLFELKRGSLTRDAVAQILDYGSDLAGKDPEDLIRLIERNSGQHGIDEIEDFADWLQREFPDAPELLEKAPRLVLVGLGVDERARRMVSFLADCGVDIQLLTFQAFQIDGRLVLARTSVTVDPKEKRAASAAGTKAGNLRALRQLAAEVGVEHLLDGVAEFIEERLPGSYRWPGKQTIGFSLPERTAEGKPTLRAYLVLWIHKKRPGVVLLSVSERGLETAPDAVDSFLDTVPEARRSESRWTPIEFRVTQENWQANQDAVEELLSSLVGAWRAKQDQEQELGNAEA